MTESERERERERERVRKRDMENSGNFFILRLDQHLISMFILSLGFPYLDSKPNQKAVYAGTLIYQKLWVLW